MIKFCGEKRRKLVANEKGQELKFEKILPDESLKDVAYNEIALGDDDEKSNVSPSKQGELFHVVAFDQGKDEPDEANDVQGEGDEAVVFD